MKLLLSKYFLIEKATLPNNITPTAINAMETDVSGIMAARFKPFSPHQKVFAPTIQAAHQALMAQHDFKPESIKQWYQNFQKKHEILLKEVTGMASVLLLSGSVHVHLQGNLEVWRVRKGSVPTLFRDSTIENTQVGDVWLILYDDEPLVKPDQLTFNNGVPYEYALKTAQSNTNAGIFYILEIENQVNTNNVTEMSRLEDALAARVLKQVYRLIDAQKPFAAYESLCRKPIPEMRPAKPNKLPPGFDNY